MDPDAALEQVIDAAIAGDGASLRAWAEGLADWLDGGGFPPADPRKGGGAS